MEKTPRGKCDICPLTIAKFVPSELHDSGILALAEAPGFTEVQEGRPLVGIAGQVLDKIIEDEGGARELVNFMNAVTCRPTKVVDGKTYNRTPTIEEIEACSERLIAEIDNLHPTIIVSMGKTPYIALGGDLRVAMKDVVGTVFTWRGLYDVIVTYHPAAIAHSGGVGSANGKRYRDEIAKAFRTAFNTKPQPKQLRLV